jgi:hypothetical protein
MEENEKDKEKNLLSSAIKQFPNGLARILFQRLSRKGHQI